MLKKYKYIITGLSLLLVVAFGFGYKTYEDKRGYKILLENQYQRHLYDLISDMNTLDVSLSKVLISGSKEQGTVLYGDIWRQARSARDKINSLPLSNIGVNNVAKFLSQLSDFSYAMMKSNVTGNTISKRDFGSLEKLRDYCGYVTVQLNDFVNTVGNEGISFNDLNQSGSQFLNTKQDDFNVVFQNMSDQIQEYPTLIYDGPFSENVLNIKPLVTKQKVVSIEEAKKVVGNIFGANTIDKIEVNLKKNNYRIPAYSFFVKLKGRNAADINIDISKNGGHILYMLDSRNVGTERLDLRSATKIGSEFLRKINYPNMTPTYTLMYDGIVIVNYVSVVNKTLIYPDQVKLKIALDNGNIVGVEAQQYLVAHQKRNLPKLKISAQEAAKKVNKRLKITNTRLTLIPLESLKEVLCYEFYGDYNGERYFVYISVTDGSEVRILKVINSSKGELTM